MTQITVELESLSPAQRDALADFILSFDPEIISIPAFATADGILNQHCGDDFPEPGMEVDADAEAAAIFGAPLLEVIRPTQVFTPEPPAPAPLAAVPPAPPVASALDKAGLPWDERIHAGSRAKTADGSWRMKRGVDPAIVAQVEGELKALMGLPAPAIPPPPPPATIAAVPPPPAIAEDRQSYVTLLSVASAAINAKKLTAEQLANAVALAGVPSLPLLANRLDLVPQVMTAVKAIIEAAA